MEGKFTQSTLAFNRGEELLEEVPPCHFPRYGSGTNDQEEVLAVDVKLEQLVKLQNLAAAGAGELESVLQTAWALLLRCYTGIDEVCFGYQESRSEAQGNGFANGAGDEVFDMPLVRMSFEDGTQISKSVGMARRAYSQELRSLAPGQKRSHNPLSSRERQLFNTTVVLEKQKGANTRDVPKRQPSLDTVGTSLGVSIALLVFLEEVELILHLRAIFVFMLQSQRINSALAWNGGAPTCPGSRPRMWSALSTSH